MPINSMICCFLLVVLISVFYGLLLFQVLSFVCGQHGNKVAVSTSRSMTLGRVLLQIRDVSGS